MLRRILNWCEPFQDSFVLVRLRLGDLAVANVTRCLFDLTRYLAEWRLSIEVGETRVILTGSIAYKTC